MHRFSLQSSLKLEGLKILFKVLPQQRLLSQSNQKVKIPEKESLQPKSNKENESVKTLFYYFKMAIIF